MAIKSAKKLIYNIRWDVTNFLNPFQHSSEETYELKTTKNPDRISAIVAFENDMLDENIDLELKRVDNKYQKKLKSKTDTIIAGDDEQN